MSENIDIASTEARATLSVTAKLVLEAAGMAAVIGNESAVAKIDQAYYLLLDAAKDIDTVQEASFAKRERAIESEIDNCLTEFEEESDGK